MRSSEQTLRIEIDEIQKQLADYMRQKTVMFLQTMEEKNPTSLLATIPRS